MKNKSEKKERKIKSFQALNDNVQIRPIAEKNKKYGNVYVGEDVKEKEAMGEILSISKNVKEDIKVGDIVIYNPHMITREFDLDTQKIIIINVKAIGGKIIYES